MAAVTDPRRRIPAVETLLSDPSFEALGREFGRERVLHHLRLSLEHARTSGEPGAIPGDPGDPGAWAERVLEGLRREGGRSLRPVINATGVVLHTNLGRAPLAEAAIQAMTEVGAGYANLEYDLDEGARGSRYEHCATLLAELAGSEAALVVNNAAAGLLLALTALARGRGVAVSRGELVEIGGGFRIPEILERSGARLVEVGSTNRTRVADYRQAVEEGSAHALLKVHRSNFAMSGFVEEASVDDLAALAEEHGVPLIHDLGSGLFVDPESLGLPPEPRAADSVRAGADLVVVSGDKLFGGPQAGIVVGRAEAIEALRRDPLCRAVRVDKATLAGVEATARLYRRPEAALREIPTLRMLAVSVEELKERAHAFAERVAAAGVCEVGVAATSGRIGGGTYPGVTLPSWGVTLSLPAGATVLAGALRAGTPPVIARIEGERVVLDLRTVAVGEEDGLARRVAEALSAASA